MIVDKEKKKKTRPVEGPAEEEEKIPASVEENGPSEEELRKEAQAELERAKADAEEFKRKWYAVSAEYENYRKRTVSQSAQRYREGRADVVAGLFPVADNLSRAIASCRDEATLKGLDMVMKAFSKLLADEQITEIDPKASRSTPKSTRRSWRWIPSRARRAERCGKSTRRDTNRTERCSVSRRSPSLNKKIAARRK